MRVPKEIETCPLCKEKIFFWKHFIACEKMKESNEKTRKELSETFRKLRIERRNQDIMEDLFLDQNWNFIQR